MTPLYWQVYLNLEREFLGLADTIFVNDAQQAVYSMKIADLLIRTVIEIEALAKELYLQNGGAVVSDEEMYFDTICINHLNNLWKLSSKEVLVVSPNIYFEKEENKVLRPLHKAHKRGTSSADWNKAYQAVKHNRVKELAKGNMKHFLHALAALYVLNLYYRNETVTKVSEKDKANVSPNFGSSIFAVKIHRCNGLGADGVYQKDTDYDECVYIEDHEPDSKKVALEAMTAMNDYVNQRVQPEMLKLANDRLSKGEALTDEWIEQQRVRLLKDILPIKDYKLAHQIQSGLAGLHYDIVLNKQQY